MEALAQTSIGNAARPPYRGCWPQPKKQKEIEARNFLQKSEEVTDQDSIRSYPLRDLVKIPYFTCPAK